MQVQPLLQYRESEVWAGVGIAAGKTRWMYWFLHGHHHNDL
jgi:hypothetical protein